MRWRPLSLLLILFTFEHGSFASCGRNLDVDSIFAHELKLSNEALTYLHEIPEAEVYLRSFRRVFASLTPENLKRLSLAVTTATDPIYLFSAFYQADWESGDYLTLSELLDHYPTTGRTQIILDPDVPADQSLSAAQIQRLRNVLENDNFRRGLKSIYDRSDISVLVKANALDLSALVSGDEVNQKTANAYRALLDLSATRLHKMAIPEGAFRLYRKVLRVYPLSILAQLDDEQFSRVVVSLEGGVSALNRHETLTLLAPMLRQLPMALDVIDYYFFGAKTTLSLPSLCALILQNARQRLLAWRAEYTRHLNEADARAAKALVLPEVQPIKFDVRDYFVTNTAPRRLRSSSPTTRAPVRTSLELASIARDDDLALFDQDKRGRRPLADLIPLHIYQFYILRPGHPGRRQIQFYPEAVTWIQTHPREADAFIRSILLGGTAGPKGSGFKKLINLNVPGGGRALEIKTIGNYRARVVMLDHVYRVLSFARKDKMRSDPKDFRASSTR